MDGNNLTALALTKSGLMAKLMNQSGLVFINLKGGLIAAE
jgi:hypothetical protein